jgi:hypothetical protein
VSGYVAARSADTPSAPDAERLCDLRHALATHPHAASALRVAVEPLARPTPRAALGLHPAPSGGDAVVDRRRRLAHLLGLPGPARQGRVRRGDSTRAEMSQLPFGAVVGACGAELGAGLSGAERGSGLDAGGVGAARAAG